MKNQSKQKKCAEWPFGPRSGQESPTLGAKSVNQRTFSRTFASSLASTFASIILPHLRSSCHFIYLSSRLSELTYTKLSTSTCFRQPHHLSLLPLEEKGNFLVWDITFSRLFVFPGANISLFLQGISWVKCVAGHDFYAPLRKINKPNGTKGQA